MDGYAIKTEDFTEGKSQLFQKGILTAGEDNTNHIKNGECVQIMTGCPVPQTADAVVKKENTYTDSINKNTIHFNEPNIKKNLNVCLQGEDAKKGQCLLQQGTLLKPSAISVCAAVGKAEVSVYQKPRIAIITTGNEIIPCTQRPLPHQIRNSNSYCLQSLCRKIYIESDFLGIIEDNEKKLKEAILEGLNYDILILSGGVSMGKYDLVPQLLEQCNIKPVFHKVQLKPGKPFWFGKGKQTTVFALPGNPVSVQVTFKLFVEPYIMYICGKDTYEPEFLHLPLAEEISIESTNLEKYLPAVLSSTQTNTTIKCVSIKSSGDFFHNALSDGIIKYQRNTSILRKNQLAPFLLW